MEEEKSGVLYFRFGENFGALLHQISWEHLTNEFDYIKAYRCFADSGAPVDYWLSLFTGKNLLKVGDDEVSLYIVDRESLSEEELKNYPPMLSLDFIEKYMDEEFERLCRSYKDIRNHYSKICNYNITLCKEDIDILYDCDISSKINYDFRAYITLTINDVMNLWNDNNEKIINMLLDKDKSTRTYNDRLSEIFNDLSYISIHLDKDSKFIKMVLWLCEQLGWKVSYKFKDFSNVVRALACILVMTKEKNYDELSIFFDNHDELNTQVDSIVDNIELSITDSKNIVVKQSDIDKMLDKYTNESPTIKPVDIDNFFDAGFISPDGLVYAMRGQTSDLIHIQLADELFKIYDIKVNEKNFGKDYALMSAGWIKFHHADIYYYGHEITNLNSFCWKIRLPSKRQLEILDKYALKHWKGYISINNKQIDVNKYLLQEATSEELESIFEI